MPLNWAVLKSLTTSVISKHIQKDWSPEQVQGRLISEGMPIVCTTTIYAFIKRDKASGGDLYQHLRHRVQRQLSWPARDNYDGRLIVVN